MNANNSRLPRRAALKWIAAAATAFPALDWAGLGATFNTNSASATGTLTDPELQQIAPVPWPRTFTREELRTATALCDTIIPADYQFATKVSAPMPAPVAAWFLSRPPKVPAPGTEAEKAGINWLDAAAQERFERNYSSLPDDLKAKLQDDISPSASQLKVPDFLDEWISAPYPLHQADKKTIRDGLAWLNSEARQRAGKTFAEAAEPQRHAICADICFEPKAKAPFQSAAAFFTRVRNLTAAGFYTTKAGMKDIRYVGNVAMQTFKGPPPEVLERLKLVSG